MHAITYTEAESVLGWGQEISGHFTSFYHQNIKVQTFQQSQELFAAAASEVS